MKTLRLILFGAVLGAGGVALADRAVTLLSATAKVDNLCIHRDGSTVTAEAWGQATDASGTYVHTSSTQWQLTGSALTTATGFLDGAAPTRWKAQEGL